LVRNENLKRKLRSDPLMEHFFEENGVRIIENNPHHFVWHQDAEDREISLLRGERWFLQFEHELPKLLQLNEKIFIQKEKWHRVFCLSSKDTNDLEISIKKFS